METAELAPENFSSELTQRLRAWRAADTGPTSSNEAFEDDVAWAYFAFQGGVEGVARDTATVSS